MILHDKIFTGQNFDICPRSGSNDLQTYGVPPLKQTNFAS